VAQAPAIAGDGSKAKIYNNGFGVAKGVESEVDAYRVPHSNAATEGSDEAQAGASNPENPVFVPNHCVGITSGGFEFDLFSDSSCGSFAAPPPLTSRTFDPAAPPTPEQLAAIAADRAISLAPRPRLDRSPRSVGLTGLRSFFWLGRKLPVVSAQASIPGLIVTAEARPVQYVWTFGDGKETTTRHPGRRWTRRRPGNIAHLYETKGRYDLSVEVIWQAVWSTNGSAWRPLGYFSNSDEVSYPVREMRSMLVRSRP
jgi:hypothetical protein